MVRAIPLLLLIAWAGPVFATGFDEIPCPKYALSRAQLAQFAAKVHADTGLQLEDRAPFSCSRGGTVSVYSATIRAQDPDGAESWVETQCEFDRETTWECKYIGQRILRFRGPWRDGDAEVFISKTANGVLARRRLDEAWALTGTLREQNHCDPRESAGQQLLELKSDLAYPWNTFQLAMEDERVTLWTTRYAVHFTAGSPEAALQLRCWRPRKSPMECLTTRCPA